MTNKENLRCVVERVTYQNNETGYTVIKCRVKGYRDLIAMTGSMPEIHAGSVLNVTGKWNVNPKYGRQFSIETFEETLPATVFGIEKYLGSGLIKGVGPKYAKKIVQQFGKDTLEIIETEPDRLLEVDGIGKIRVERIKQSWEDQKEVKNIMLFLQSHNVSSAHATKIYKAYGNESIGIIQENPYRLADDIWGIGFVTADMIAEKLGFGHEKFMRLRSGILYTLNRLSEEGHCYATRDMLIEKSTELLKVEDSLISMTLDNMIHEKDVITEENPDIKNGDTASRCIYLPPFYFSEAGVAKRLNAIAGTESKLRIDTRGLEKRIRKATGIEYDTTQIEAIMKAVTSKVLVLTGGPGTGKTTTTLGIITAFKEAGSNILLAAPTGRAAKRLSEASGLEAKTIHRLLEAKPPEGYKKGADNPLQGDVLIVDECSMIDVILMYNLLKAVPDNMTLILVGDTDQLPSVGAGNVLKDIIASDCFPVVRLTKIFRQAQKSRIIMNAHRINAGKMPDISNGHGSDFFFIELPENKKENEENSTPVADSAAEEIVKLVKTRLPKFFRINPQDIQILTPMQRGKTGTIHLNEMLQNELNPGIYCLRRGGYLFKPKDKVMQIRNNYDKEIFNGDIGVVESVDLEDHSLVINFDGRPVKYDSAELDEIVLAYAVTIHKSQGSEYPVVVMPLLMNHYIMLQRNLIYTGITRAKKGLVIVGSKKALGYAVRNSTVEKRNTMLETRIRNCRLI